MNEENVVHLHFERAPTADLERELLELVYTYSARMSVAEAVGCLELAKLTIVANATAG